MVFPPEAIALEGEAAPGGGSFAGFGAPAQNEIDDVAFSAVVSGVASTRGVFLYDEGGDSLSAVARRGDTAPGTGGLQTFLDFVGVPDIDPDGDLVAFRANLSPGLANGGIFRSDSGTVSAIALEGDPAPGTGSSFSGIFFDPRVSRVGDAVAFSAFLADGSSGVFVDSGGVIAPVVLSGAPAPGVTGGSFVGFGAPDISEEDELAFLGVADAGGPGFEYGIFRYSAGTGSLIALDGNPAPGGGVYDFDSGGESELSLLPGGLLVFSDATRVFSHSTFSGTLRRAEVGETAPDTGGSFADFIGRPGFGAGELYVFLADVSGGSASGAIFAKRAGFDEGALVAEGDAAPDTGGGSFAAFPFAPSGRAYADDPGRTTFTADVVGGSATSGVFQLPEPRGELGLLACCALLGMLGHSRRRR